MKRAFVTLSLAALYLGVLGSAAPADVVVALLVGFVVSVLTTSPRGGFGGARASLRRLVYLPVFLLGVVIEAWSGAFGMALVIVGVRDWRKQGYVEVDIGPRTSVGVTVSSLVTSLSPGSVVVDVDRERGKMLLHVIDASDEERVRAQLQRFYRRYQAAVFP